MLHVALFIRLNLEFATECECEQRLSWEILFSVALEIPPQPPFSQESQSSWAGLIHPLSQLIPKFLS